MLRSYRVSSSYLPQGLARCLDVALRRYRALSSYSPSFAVDDFDSLFRRYRASSSYSPSPSTASRRLRFRRYRASSSYLPRDRFQKRLHALRRDRDSSINLLGYGTSDTAIVLHRSRASSGYSLFRVNLAKQFAWFVKPLERTAPVIISNNQVELYGLGLNYETCPRAIAL